MAQCLSKMPSVCLEAIFKQVPLSDLLRSVGLVCKSWYVSHRIELIRRRRLVVMEHESDLDKFEHSLINCSYQSDLIGRVRAEDGSPFLTLESLDQIKFDLSLMVENGYCYYEGRISALAPLMPNITHLVMMFPDCPNYDMPPLIRLIGQYSQQLVILKLHIGYISSNIMESGADPDEEVYDEDRVRQYATDNVANLFACLERLCSLRHLRLSLNYYYFSILDIAGPQLSFLSRLDTLALEFVGIFEEDFIVASLNQYGTEINTIDLYNSFTLPQLGQIRLPADKLNVLALNRPQDFDDMRRFCGRFTSLTKLSIFRPDMAMSTLSRCLSLLTALVHFDVSYGIIPQIEQEEADDDDDDEEEEHEQQQEAAQQIEFAQVPSVRLLSLSFESETHHDSERLFISDIFPNVQVIRLENRIRQCAHCEIPFVGWAHSIKDAQRPEGAARFTECVRLSRQPFRACANLHTIAGEAFKKDTIILCKL